MKDLVEIRNDVVGSLLRPAGLKQARQRYDEGKLRPRIYGNWKTKRFATPFAFRKSWGWPCDGR